MTYRQLYAKRLEMGYHPFGAELAKNGKTCGDCKHATPNCSRAKRWYKCALSRITGGTATDLKVGWPACVRFEEAGK